MNCPEKVLMPAQFNFHVGYCQCQVIRNKYIASHTSNITFRGKIAIDLAGPEERGACKGRRVKRAK